MKEQVIVFEGEQMFVAPKKRISNKSKGIQIEVPEVYAAGDPVEPAEPVRIITTPPSGSGDIGVRQPQTYVTTPPPVVPETNMGNVPERIPAGDVVTPRNPIDLIVDPIGNPARKFPQAGQETTTPITPPPAPPAEPKITQKLILAPTTLGSAPVMGGGGFGGGGGGGEEEAVVPEKKNYLWLWILLAGGAIYLLTKKKK